MLSKIANEYLTKPAAKTVASVNPCSRGPVRCTILRDAAVKGAARIKAAQGG